MSIVSGRWIVVAGKDAGSDVCFCTRATEDAASSNETRHETML